MGACLAGATLFFNVVGAAHAQRFRELGGINIGVIQTRWMSHDMFGGPVPKTAKNFPMPQAMMPGMQTGDVNRLHLELLFTNLTDHALRYNPSEVRAHSIEGSWGSNTTTEDEWLPAKAQLSVDLYIDVPIKQDVTYLEWDHDGGAVKIPMGVSPPSHDHGY